MPTLNARKQSVQGGLCPRQTPLGLWQSCSYAAVDTPECSVHAAADMWSADRETVKQALYVL